ncbi:hypothetical protein FSP39_020497 [Pinctada imbricata]|uniref:Major facilitator superfamily (MFS) profile domain-containing protein n=1 Tax=Pinctada imbricata TaxID=66713 RepID=A0AA89C5V1_PINIB|nr:hypothetical protein FSP39_020497 [Pinctada imbricata]
MYFLQIILCNLKGSFGVFAITVGIMKSFGVLLVELSRRYDAPASLLSSSQSLCSYLHMSVGILSNALSARFGHRRIIFCGGILTALGLMSTAFVTSIEWFFVTYGLITGFGLGLCLSPSLVFFGLFFKRNLALANGLATAGSGFGSFVFPYLMLYFLDEYSISGCMLILGAISLNICVFASLFRPLSFWNMRSQLQLSDNETINHMDSKEVTPEIKPFLIRANDTIPELNDCVLSVSDPCIHRKYGAPMRKRAATFSEDNDKNYSSPKSVVPPAMTYASIESLPIFSKNSLQQRDAYNELPDGEIQNDKKGKCSELNLSLLKSPKFHMIVWGIFCALYGHNNLFNVGPSLAVEFGFSDSEATTAVSIVGLCDLVGRIVTGIVSNNISWKRITVYRLTLTLFTIATFVLAFADSFIMFAVTCGILGFVTGGYIGIQMSVIIENLGMKNLSSAWGYAAFFVSISLLVNPVIAGVTKDSTHTWKTSVYLSAGICVLGVIILSIEDIHNKLRRLFVSS